MNLSDKMTDQLVQTLCNRYREKFFKPSISFLEYYSLSEEALIEDLKSKLDIINNSIKEAFPHISFIEGTIYVYCKRNIIAKFGHSFACSKSNDYVFSKIDLEDIYPEEVQKYCKEADEITQFNESLRNNVVNLEKNIRAAVACCISAKDFKEHFKKYNDVLTDIKNEYKKINGESDE